MKISQEPQSNKQETYPMTAQTTEKELRSIPLQDLIPQRAPFLMIDCLTGFDPVNTQTELAVREDNIFFCNGTLSASGLIENIAQTCAARMGYINLTSGEPVKLGFIGAVRGLQIFRTPKAGEVLQTTISVKEEVFRMTLVDAVVKSGDEILVSAEMKIALSETDAAD